MGEGVEGGAVVEVGGAGRGVGDDAHSGRGRTRRRRARKRGRGGLGLVQESRYHDLVQAGVVGRD